MLAFLESGGIRALYGSKMSCQDTVVEYPLAAAKLLVPLQAVGTDMSRDDVLKQHCYTGGLRRIVFPIRNRRFRRDTCPDHGTILSRTAK